MSINTLLGQPRQLICQCCGMSLENMVISHEPDGSFNESYCKWCYADGRLVYTDLSVLIDFPAQHMANETWPLEQVRTYLTEQLSKLEYWKERE